MIKKIKNNKGFALLLAVIITSILLSIALEMSKVALKEASFAISNKASNDAFYAADTALECTLYNDKGTVFGTQNYKDPSSENVNCSSGTSTKTSSYDPITKNTTFGFNLVGLGSTGNACAQVTVVKPVAFSCSKTSIIGDVNGDGDENTLDSLQVNRMINNIIPTPINICCIDANQDGVIDINDAYMIQGSYIGLDVSYVGQTCDHLLSISSTTTIDSSGNHIANISWSSNGLSSLIGTNGLGDWATPKTISGSEIFSSTPLTQDTIFTLSGTDTTNGNLIKRSVIARYNPVKITVRGYNTGTSGNTCNPTNSNALERKLIVTY